MGAESVDIRNGEVPEVNSVVEVNPQHARRLAEQVVVIRQILEREEVNNGIVSKESVIRFFLGFEQTY